MSAVKLNEQSNAQANRPRRGPVERKVRREVVKESFTTGENMNPTVMEMRLVLDMMRRSLLAVEEAQRGLELTHKDLTNQAEWIKGEISKALDV